MCYFWGTEILTYEPVTQIKFWKKIEQIMIGDFIITFPDQVPIRVEHKICGNYDFGDNSRLFRLPMHRDRRLSHDLIVSARHSIFVEEDRFIRDAHFNHPVLQVEFDDITFASPQLFYLMACWNRSFEPVAEECLEINVSFGAPDFFHLILEDDLTYIIYVNGGVLSETTNSEFVERFQ